MKRKRTYESVKDIGIKVLLSIFGLSITIINPISIFIIAVLVSVFSYSIIIRRSVISKSFLFFLSAIYSLLLLGYSISPRLQYLEFKSTHPNWHLVDGNITNIDITWVGGKSKYATSMIQYSFYVDGKNVSERQTHAVKNYSYNSFRVSERDKNKLKLELREGVEEYVKNNNFKICYNANENDSRLFIPLNAILLSNSFGFRLLFVLFKLSVIIVLMLGIIIGIVIVSQKIKNQIGN